MQVKLRITIDSLGGGMQDRNRAFEFCADEHGGLLDAGKQAARKYFSALANQCLYCKMRAGITEMVAWAKWFSWVARFLENSGAY